MEEVERHGEHSLARRLAESFEEHFRLQLAARSDDGFSETELNNLTTELASVIPFDTASLNRIKEQITNATDDEAIMEIMRKIFQDIYQLREDTLGTLAMREIERYVFLSSIDEQWMDHLDNMTNLRDAVWLRGGKEQALAEYKKEAFSLFESMIKRVELESLKKVFRIHLRPVPDTQPPADLTLSGPAKTQLDMTATTDSTSSPKPGKKKSGQKQRGKRKSKGSYLKK